MWKWQEKNLHGFCVYYLCQNDVKIFLHEINMQFVWKWSETFYTLNLYVHIWLGKVQFIELSFSFLTKWRAVLVRCFHKSLKCNVYFRLFLKNKNLCHVFIVTILLARFVNFKYAKYFQKWNKYSHILICIVSNTKLWV